MFWLKLQNYNKLNFQFFGLIAHEEIQYELAKFSVFALKLKTLAYFMASKQHLAAQKIWLTSQLTSNM